MGGYWIVLFYCNVGSLQFGATHYTCGGAMGTWAFFNAILWFPFVLYALRVLCQFWFEMGWADMELQYGWGTITAVNSKVCSFFVPFSSVDTCIVDDRL